MRHWIVGGALVLVGTVFVFRSRTSVQQTVPPAATRGVSLPSMMPTVAPATMPATTRGIPLSAIRGMTRYDDVAMERRVPPELLLVRAQPAAMRVRRSADARARRGSRRPLRN